MLGQAFIISLAKTKMFPIGLAFEKTPSDEAELVSDSPEVGT